MSAALVITGFGAQRPATRPAPVAACSGPAAAPFPPGVLGHAVDLDAVSVLGRKAVRFNHRTTLLAMAACEAALADAGLALSAAAPVDTVGVCVGTECGSLSGSVEFGWDTYAQPLPHQVDAATFPNSVLNAAAGAVAIRHGLRGPNSTVAAGVLAGIGALRHAAVTLRARHADTVLVGAADELSAPRAWAYPGPVGGEGAGMLVLERADVAAAGGRAPLAGLGTVLVTAADPTRPDAVAELLATAVGAASVRRVLARRTGDAAIDAALAAVAELDDTRTGDCRAAHAALQLVELVELAAAERWTPADVGVVLGADPDGALGVAVLSGPPA